MLSNEALRNAANRPMAVVLLALLAMLAGGGQVLAQGTQAGQQTSSGGVQWLEEVAEVPYVVAGQLQRGGKGLALRIRMASGEEGANGLALEISNGRARFFIAANGKVTPLGIEGQMPPQGEEPMEFSLHRHAWRLAFICGGRVVCQAWYYAAPGTKERVGCEVITEGQVDDLRVQPLGAIYKADSFTRLGSGEGEWEPQRGKWEQRALREDQQASSMDATKTTNPFSYYGERGQENGSALSVVGYWFWTDYRISASVRGGADSIIGLVVCYQDVNNYLGVKWTSSIAATEPQTIKLVAVREGKETVIGQARVGFLPDQWYSLSLGYSEGRLVCWVDGRKRLAGDTELFGQGAAGLLADGKEGVFFDDIVVEEWNMVKEDFQVAKPGKWLPQSGEWQTTGGVLKTSGQVDALILTGQPEWKNYRVAANVKLSEGEGGIVVGAGESTVVAGAVQKRGGKDRLVILKKVGSPAGQWEELAATSLGGGAAWRRLDVSAEDGIVVASCEGVKVRAFVPGAGQGRVGLLARGGAGAAFDDFALEFIAPPTTTHVVKEFTDVQQHFEMAEWASTRHAWVAAADELGASEEDKAKMGGMWWTKGDFFGDYWVTVPLSGVGANSFSITVVLNAEPGWEGTGVGVQIEAKQGEKALTFTISNGPATVVTERVEVESATPIVRCARRAEFVVVEVDGKVIYGGNLVPPKGNKSAEGKK